MAEETKKTPQTPEEIAREAQAQAMKAALEQAQALYGNVPGFEGTDLMKMHEKLMQDSAEMFPGVAEAQAYQAKMMAESAQDPEAIMETYSKNIEFAGNMMQQAMNAGFMPEGLPDFSDGFDVYAGWEITRKGDNSLTPEQNRLLAYGAPLFLYNDDNVDSLESTAGTDTLKEMLEEWWEVTDRKSALETISWLLNEGQHAGADPALTEIRQRGIEAITEEEKADEDSKIGDAFTIAEFVMGVNETTEADLPETVLAWDLVRAVNMARWAFICGYINEDEMWEAIRTTAGIAKESFNSWEEYGNSFAVGRGIWRGETDDYETADEVVGAPLNKEDSPWKAIEW